MLNRVKRIVDRGLAGMLPNAYVSPFTPPQHSNYRQLAHFDKTSFATFALSHDITTPLYKYYRDFVKRTWRLSFPALSYLYNLHSKFTLPPETRQLLEEILQSSTLTMTETVLNDYMEKMAAQYPQVTKKILLPDGTSTYGYAPSETTRAVVKSYRTSARRLETQLRRAGHLSLKGLHTLEIGTGTGLNCYAVAERGTDSSTGIDIEYLTDGVVFRQDAIEVFLQNQPSLAARVNLLNMDANHTTFDSARFDVIHSTSVLEHVQDLPQTFREMYRLLKPGGWAIHSINPYFGPGGGHALVTLDFAWGHARLSDDQIQTYLQTYRPHEAEKAAQFLAHGLTHPHHILGDYALFALQAGFEIIHWEENWLDNHRSLLTSQVYEQVQSNYPRVTLNDLLTNELMMVLHKPHDA